MTISFINLVGVREAPDKTIRYLLATNWLTVNTLNKSPVFQSDSEEPDTIATNDYTSENLVTVRWLEDKKDEKMTNEYNGDTIHSWRHKLAIDFWGETMQMALLMGDEINRILWQFRPSNNTVLNKSDGTASEADNFVADEITFERIGPESKVDSRPSFAGILEINYRKLRT